MTVIKDQNTAMKARRCYFVIGVLLVLPFTAYWTLYLSRGHKLDIDSCKDRQYIDSVADRLVKMSQMLIRSKKMWTNGHPNALLDDVYKEMREVLTTMGHQQELQESEKSLGNPEYVQPDVCGETYIRQDGNKTDPRYIYHRRVEFRTEKCTDVPEFHTLITLVYNFVHYDSKYYQLIPTIFHDVQKLYPKVRVIAAIPETLTLDEKDFINTTLQTFSNSTAESDIWTQLISKVRTKYVYIGRDVVRITWFDRLERLVREINNLEASVVASAYRTWKGGEWNNGCEQSALSNYQLVYRHGYKHSAHECLLCHHIHGPFVAKKKLFKRKPLPARTSSTSSFAMWFLGLKSSSLMVVSCPDSMSFVTDESRLPASKGDWVGLASTLQVEHINLNNQHILEFDCEEAKTYCPGHSTVGQTLSMCCKRELSDGIKLVMDKCRAEGLVCQLNAGTNLGAVKFNSIIPWDNDADILIHPDDIEAFGNIETYFETLGYSTSSLGYGYTLINSKHWTIEIYADNIQIPGHYGITPTLIDLDGSNVETVISPGLFARNMYGKEIYQHVQHWRQITPQGKKISSLWDFFNYADKKFTKCPSPGHHSCLDQHIPDGDFIFKEPVI